MPDKKENMMKRAIIVSLGLATASGAMAGTLDLNSQSFSSLYDYTTSSNVATNPQSSSGSYTGTLIGGQNQVQGDCQVNGDASGAGNVVSGSITSETTGSFFLQDGMYIDGPTYGAVLDTQGSYAKYTFTTGTSSLLSLSYNLTISSSGVFTGGFGLYNYELYVDGVEYPASGITTPPATSGSWLIPLLAGTHEIDAYSNSNIATTPGVGSMGLTENVNFSALATPEPAPFAMLGLGVVGLLIRRRNRR